MSDAVPSREGLVNFVLWLQNDSEYLYRKAREYRDAGDTWQAIQVQRNAANSASLARATVEQLKGMS